MVICIVKNLNRGWIQLGESVYISKKIQCPPLSPNNIPTYPKRSQKTPSAFPNMSNKSEPGIEPGTAQIRLLVQSEDWPIGIYTVVTRKRVSAILWGFLMYQDNREGAPKSPCGSHLAADAAFVWKSMTLYLLENNMFYSWGSQGSVAGELSVRGSRGTSFPAHCK